MQILADAPPHVLFAFGVAAIAIAGTVAALAHDLIARWFE